MRFIFVSLLFLNLSASEKNMPYYIAGAAAALVIGKLAYDYYQTHKITPQQIIDESQILFQKIKQDIKKYHDFYCYDAQMGDWNLKDMIIGNYKESYPFLMYYKDLCHALSVLQKHLVTLSAQLIHIKKYKKELEYKKLFLQLARQEKNLHKQISKIISLLTSLKIRIELFKEYNEDCYYSEQKIGNHEKRSYTL